MIFLGLFALAAGLNILVGLPAWPHVLAGNLQDPDSYMRLLRLQQGVRAGHLLTNVAGDQSGAGVMVEWSRLLDMLLWLLAAPMAPFIGWQRAIFAAGVASGPFWVGALGASAGWAVERLALRRYLWAAAAAAGLLPALASIAMPGVVHYHVALLAGLALTAGCVLRALRGDHWYGFLAGLAGGFSLWMTPETMPFVLMAYAGLALRYCFVPNGAVLLATAAGFFDVLGAALAVDPPAGGYGVAEIDRLSYVYVVLALLLLGGALLLRRLQALPPRGRGAFGLALLAALMALWIANFPDVVKGPAGLLPPAAARAFFGVITEQQAPHGLQFIIFLLPGVWAMAFAAGTAWRERRPALADMAAPLLLGAPARAPLGWGYVALCAAIALALGARWLLFASLSALFAVCLLPVALSRIETAGGALAPLRRVGLLALVLAVPFLAALAHPGQGKQAAGPAYPSCSLHDIAPLLAPYAGQVVLADPSATPELLYRTRVKTVGSLFHHGIGGFMRDRAAWRGAPGATLPPAVAATGARAILFCPQAGRTLLVADLPRDTLWDALQAGQAPPWLRLAGTDAAGWRLYAVQP